MNEQLKYKVALGMVPGIGGVLARNLIKETGSAEAVFTESPGSLMKIPGIGAVNARRITDSAVLKRAEEELNFIEKNGIRTWFYEDQDYPRRLRNCEDAPIIFYSKGKVDLNAGRVVSIVGTRNATGYGKEMCDQLVELMAVKGYRVLIVSGLAYGIDIRAHRAAVKHGLPTAGVLAHGLDTLYPALHKKTAGEMMECGALVTDFPSRTKIDPPNFLRRNRIIAGLADATIVVESARKGGALVTADIALSYNRDVFAFPGRAGDPFSSGCNRLIKNNSAALIEGIDDLEYYLGWESKKIKKPAQPSLFIELSDLEKKVADLLAKRGEMVIDQIAAELELPVSKVSGLLLEMEFKNVLAALPGQLYSLR